jgi:hypothetical protein
MSFLIFANSDDFRAKIKEKSLISSFLYEKFLRCTDIALQFLNFLASLAPVSYKLVSCITCIYLVEPNVPVFIFLITIYLGNKKVEYNLPFYGPGLLIFDLNTIH